MKSQATVHSMKRKPNALGAPIAHPLTINIENGVPKIDPKEDNTPVATGDTVTWTCSPSIAGTLKLYFDPFHHIVFACGTWGPGEPPIQLGPYTVMSEQPPKGQQGKQFHYHMSWTDAVHGTHGTDPIIIVDPTNNPKK